MRNGQTINDVYTGHHAGYTDADNYYELRNKASDLPIVRIYTVVLTSAMKKPGNPWSVGYVEGWRKRENECLKNEEKPETDGLLWAVSQKLAT